MGHELQRLETLTEAMLAKASEDPKAAAVALDLLERTATILGIEPDRRTHVHQWRALRSVPPKWSCATCPAVTDVRP